MVVVVAVVSCACTLYNTIFYFQFAAHKSAVDPARVLRYHVPAHMSTESDFVVGVIGGSGLLKTQHPLFKSLERKVVSTKAGDVILHVGCLPSGGTLVFVQRHRADPDSAYTQVCVRVCVCVCVCIHVCVCM